MYNVCMYICIHVYMYICISKAALTFHHSARGFAWVCRVCLCISMCVRYCIVCLSCTLCNRYTEVLQADKYIYMYIYIDVHIHS